MNEQLSFPPNLKKSYFAFLEVHLLFKNSVSTRGQRESPRVSKCQTAKVRQDVAKDAKEVILRAFGMPLPTLCDLCVLGGSSFIQEWFFNILLKAARLWVNPRIHGVPISYEECTLLSQIGVQQSSLEI